MSVRGEFVRTVGDAIALLQESDTAPARALAEQLEPALRLASDDLEGAARALIGHWEVCDLDALDLVEPDRASLGESAERMLAISKLILGR